ncbi:SipW-dependent-type signal peptide-containing protein [Gordonia sp. (in: high G+C Gram-positive bacteria)]|uniref:SipW-dependent-type signal peptide-containing protein n=1 Tax=Gordonia sp. (in: high G+C Gram-positive bacteria) TaxID=84139 RepID=UPI003C776BDA
MSSPNETRGPAQPVAAMRSRLGDTGWTRARAIASLGMVLGLGAVGTMAAWSDTATASTGMFSVSSVNVQLKLNSQHPTYTFAALQKINMSRGASTAAMLPVNNTGDTDFNYTTKVVSTDNGTATYGSASAATFAQNLTVAVFNGGSSNGTTCSGGTAVATKDLALGSVDLISTARNLAKTNTENLCVQVTLKANAPLEARMSALNVDFKFAATQA